MRFLAFLDHAGHRAVADLYGHVIDSGIFGQRESVDRFNVLRCGVFKCLGDSYTSYESADRAANVGVLERAYSRKHPAFANDLQGSRRLAWRSGHGIRIETFARKYSEQ